MFYKAILKAKLRVWVNLLLLVTLLIGQLYINLNSISLNAATAGVAWDPADPLCTNAFNGFDNSGGELTRAIAPDESGGAFVSIAKYLSGNPNQTIVVQHINGTTGGREWGNTGVILGTSDGYSAFLTKDGIISDGTGGMIAIYTLNLAGNDGIGEVYIQRVDSNGNKLWGRMG